MKHIKSFNEKKYYAYSVLPMKGGKYVTQVTDKDPSNKHATEDIIEISKDEYLKLKDAKPIRTTAAQQGKEVKLSTKKIISKHLKDSVVNEEFFGGKSSDVLLPKLDTIDAKLAEIRTKITSGMSDDDTRKIETIYNYLIDNMDLDMLATQSRKSAELTGRKSKETFGEKVKRSAHNF